MDRDPNVLQEFYSTPSLARLFWKVCHAHGADHYVIIEPCAGTGQLTREFPPGAVRHRSDCNGHPARGVHTASYADLDPGAISGGRPACIVANPPFRWGTDFFNDMARHSAVVMIIVVLPDHYGANEAFDPEFALLDRVEIPDAEEAFEAAGGVAVHGPTSIHVWIRDPELRKARAALSIAGQDHLRTQACEPDAWVKRTIKPDRRGATRPRAGAITQSRPGGKDYRLAIPVWVSCVCKPVCPGVRCTRALDHIMAANRGVWARSVRTPHDYHPGDIVLQLDRVLRAVGSA